MYGLLLFLTLASLWLFARLLNAEGRARGLQAALFLVNLLLVYTHYYGWLVVACEAALVALKERRRLGAFLLALGGLALAYAPWVLACASASRSGGGLAQNIGWIARPGARDLAQLFALFNEPFYFRQSSADPVYARGGALFGLLFVGLPVLALLARAFFKSNEEARGEAASSENERRAETRQSILARPDGAVLFLLVFAVAPVALAFAASYALPQSVWGTRHLIVAFAPYALLAGLALAGLRQFWLKWAALALLCCWFAAVGALNLLRRDAPYVWCAWEGLAASAARDEARGPSAGGASNVNSTVGSDGGRARVYAFEDLVAYHLWFALERGRSAGRFRVVNLEGAHGVAEDPAYFLPRGFEGVTAADVNALEGERFWAAFRDAAWDETRPPLKLLKERGYRAERVYEAGAQGQRAFLVLFTHAAD